MVRPNPRWRISVEQQNCGRTEKKSLLNPKNTQPGTPGQNPKRGGSEKTGSASVAPRRKAPEKPAEPELPLDLSAGTPEEIWQDYFSKRKANPATVRNLVSRLHEGKQYEHVIACIGAALVNDQGQPWMYEVLALTLEIAGHPKEEVERAVYSAVDFSGLSFQNVMMSAAYLMRFDRLKAALHMYEQASRVAKSRPEAYIMGLKLARKLNDYHGIQWTTAGVLMYAWTKGYETLHKEAEDAALVAEQELRNAGKISDADAMRASLTTAKQRDLSLHLTWSGVGDLDLLVEEPPGSVCSFSEPYTIGGGVLVHDGYGPEQSNCYEQYVCPFGMPGTYRVRVRHMYGEIVGKRAKLTIVRYEGTDHETRRELTVKLDEEDQIVRLSLGQGRRTDFAEVLSSSRRRSSPPRRRSLLQMVGQLDAESRQAARDFGASRDRAATGYTPVITMISEGVSLSALAVVSGDRRYVRISALPQFSNITDVFTFSFSSGGGAGGGFFSGAPGNSLQHLGQNARGGGIRLVPLDASKSARLGSAVPIRDPGLFHSVRAGFFPVAVWYDTGGFSCVSVDDFHWDEIMQRTAFLVCLVGLGLAWGGTASPRAKKRRKSPQTTLGKPRSRRKNRIAPPWMWHSRRMELGWSRRMRLPIAFLCWMFAGERCSMKSPSAITRRLLWSVPMGIRCWSVANTPARFSCWTWFPVA